MFLISFKPAGSASVMVAAMLLALGACTPLPPVASTTPAAATPAAVQLPPAPASAATAAALQIDSAASLIAVTVRRGGVLARLGHDHVVAARTITGTVSPQTNRADFQFRLDQMTVDEPALRQVAGLTTQPSPDAIAGTRTNMLTKVLDAERYPLVTVQVERAEVAKGAAPRTAGQPLRVAITLHGVTRAYAIPVTIVEQDGSLTVTGTVDLKQTDFGLTPFSVMGGAMAVQDQMALRFTLVAR
jgi:polyisoprenoid-binding protein YceI